jgi:PAS domain-containing protein
VSSLPDAYDATFTVDAASLLLLLEGLDLPLAVVDGSGRLAVLSPALARLLDGEFRPIPVRLFTRVYDVRRTDGDEQVPPEEFPLLPALSGHATTTVGRVVAADGTERRLAFRAAPLTGIQGEVVAVVCTATDVTGGQQQGPDTAQRLVERLEQLVRTPLDEVVSHVPVLKDLRRGRP